jgi:hypothetical protein
MELPFAALQQLCAPLLGTLDRSRRRNAMRCARRSA